MDECQPERKYHIANGIVYVSPAKGLLKQLVPLGATTSGYGDGGSAYLAKLRMPSDMTIDSSNRLIVRDYDRIRRIDLNQNPPTINTIIGGGTSTADTIANPLTLSISSVTAFTNRYTTSQLKVLPNGNIYYCSSTNGLVFLRNMDTSVEVQLAWSIPSMQSTGTSLVYDPANHVLVFPFIQNGLTGVGELSNVDPDLNGV